MFIVNLKYVAQLDIVDKHIEAHRKWLDTMYVQNKFLCSGPQNPRIGGIIVAITTDVNELKEILRHDPYNINHIAEYEITEFHALKQHPILKELSIK